jgi:hypothetical protein
MFRRRPQPDSPDGDALAARYFEIDAVEERATREGLRESAHLQHGFLG